MERWSGKIAVVTGAGGGIGAAITAKLLGHGLTVIGFDRDVEAMRRLSPLWGDDKLIPLQVDVGNGFAVAHAFRWVNDRHGGLHVLVNNAGVAAPCTLLDADYTAWRNVFDVNLVGLAICSSEAARIMRDGNVDGHIVNINSVMGHHVPPLKRINAYAASKHGVTGLTESLRHELNDARSGIKITSVSPGNVATDLLADCPEDVKSAFARAPKLRPEDVADAVIYALSTPPHVQIVELTVKPVGERY